MRTDKEIHEIIKQGFEEYAKAETKSENTEVIFSKEHEQKMKDIFDNARKEIKYKKTADREVVIRIKFGMATKIAVALIIVTVFVSAVSTGIKAWRESKLNSYEGSGDYSWMLPNDTSEVYEQKTDEEKIEYVKSIFAGLSGEISDVKIEEYSRTQRIHFKYNEQSVNIKISEKVSLGIDFKKDNSKTIILNDVEVLCYLEKDTFSYLWEKDGLCFYLYGNFSEEELIKIYESINYEKIETNF